MIGVSKTKVNFIIRILKMIIIVIMIWSLSPKYFCKVGKTPDNFSLFQKKIDKRGRKLIDFDAERHAVQQMQNNPNRNEAKFVRAKVGASREVMRKPTAKSLDIVIVIHNVTN